MSEPASTAVDRLYNEASGIVRVLQNGSEISLEIAAGENLRKGLLLAAASYFENEFCNLVLAFVRERTNGSVLVEQFVRNKAIVRQYHTWFKWDENNANQFFGLFGSDFRGFMSERVRGSDDLRNSIRAFLEIGSERNRLIHNDYATFPLDKTLDEIYLLFQKAMYFVKDLPVALRECDKCNI